MTVVVFDVESDSSFRAFSGAARDLRFRRMEVTVACALVLDSNLCTTAGDDKALASGVHHHFWRDWAPIAGKGPFEDLLRLFDEADVIVAYNGHDFDLPLMEKYYGAQGQKRYLAHRIKLLDPFSRIKAATGVWSKLDDILKANDIPPKKGDGLLAIKLWEEGKRSELLAYCTHDVVALAKACLKRRLVVPGVAVEVPSSAFGIAAALAAVRVDRPCAEEREGEDFVLV